MDSILSLLQDQGVSVVIPDQELEVQIYWLLSCEDAGKVDNFRLHLCFLSCQLDSFFRGLAVFKTSRTTGLILFHLSVY